MDRPRGIKFNQNALNIINGNNKPTSFMPQGPVLSLKQTLNSNNTDNILTKNGKTNITTTNENVLPFSSDLKFNKGDVEEQKGRISPKEPSPPKLKYNSTKSSLNLEHLQPLIQPLSSPPPQLDNKPEPLQQRSQHLNQQQQRLESKQDDAFKLPETIVSRIPKLSWLPNVALKPASATVSKSSSSLTTATTISSKITIAKLPTPTTDSDDEEIEDIDKSTSRDAIFFLCDIAKDIYDYMFSLEEAQAVREDYLSGQKILTPKVRQRLVNWCIDIHVKLGLNAETLYITIALIDRYFDRVQVKQQSLVQLAAIGATLIASKYEEIYPPDVQDLLHLAQGEYSRREVMRIEIQILEELDFDLGKPIPLAFLRRFSKAAHCDVKMHSIAKFLMELSLTEYECSHWRPSMLAAAALFATIYMVNRGNRQDTQQASGLTRRLTPPQLSSSSNKRWNKALIHYTRYTKEQLQEPAGILCKILKRALKNPQSFNCVKKVVKTLPQWPELKSARVDELIKFAAQQKQQ